MSDLKAAVLSVSYIILNPYTGYIMLYPWKDIAFALAGLWCSIYSVRLICQRKRQIPLWKLILFGFVLASGTIFRHNAILFTGPLLLVLFFHIDKKTWIKILAFTAAFLFLIKIPVYKTLHAENPGQRVLESTGLPLTVIGNVAKETPELMDEELSNFAYSVATPEQWQNEYSCGNFNSIKWYGSGINTAPIEEQGFFGMLHLMFKCFKLSPDASFTALAALTDMVYGFETGLEGDFGAEISDNPYGIAYTDVSNESLKSFL